MSLTSAAGIIALLDDQEIDLKHYALKKLDAVVDEFWAEVAEIVNKISVPQIWFGMSHSPLFMHGFFCQRLIQGDPEKSDPTQSVLEKNEELYEDEQFRYRKLCALVASKVYYHLGAFEDSLMYALGAGELFNVNSHSQYVETIIAKCIDHYAALRVKKVENSDETPIDPRLEGIVNQMFQRCFVHGKFKQAVGIALETRRLDIFEMAILKSGEVGEMLSYCLKICMTLLESRQFRNLILRVLVKLYLNLATPDYISVCECLVFLDDPDSVADILEKLVKDSETRALTSYQIAFDLYENASQQILTAIMNSLKAIAPLPIREPEIQGAEQKKPEETKPSEMEVDEDNKSKEEKDENAAKEETEEPEREFTDDDCTLQTRIIKLVEILGGECTINLHLEFLIRNNHADLLVLKSTKDAIRNSICHTATVISNAFMHSGTTSDTFLRSNLEWLSRATNWAKFSATASLGVIHKGHEKESLKLMASYLPKDGGSSSAYQEGGGLYALGLIHANHGHSIVEYLLQQLKGATTDMVRHGGCLGLGLAAMGTQRQDVYEQLKFNLYQDDAVTGEGAGISMGLVMLGSKNAQAIEEMVLYSKETQHEKILRGLSVGIALTMYGRMEEADALVESLTSDKDPILRRSGMYTIAMAYAGTGNNKAIRQLLHVAVSDVDDDVRRAAVTSIGFLLFRTPEQCPSVVSLLAESYNPNVRYGAALALGIACAGTGLKEAIALVEPMINDPVNYVRQGALIASALIAIQQTETTCSKVKSLREVYSKCISDKHEDGIAKFGAILAQGIIDAGGRNVTVSLQSRSGQNHMPSIVGLFVFSHFWYWFPLSHFLSLAFTPTSVIGLNHDLKMPKIEFRSNAKPSLYAYPEPLQPPKKEEKEKVSTAILSITAKAKARAKKSKDDEAMDVDDKDKGTEKEKKESTSETKEETKDKKSAEKSEEKVEKDKNETENETKSKTVEPDFEMLENPARVMTAQKKVITLPAGCRYSSIKPVSVGGIIMLKDSQSDEPEDLIEPLPASVATDAEDEKEPDPPEPFEYTED